MATKKKAAEPAAEVYERPAELRGPWVFGEAHGGSGMLVVRDATGEFICRVLPRHGRIVAALPRLLEALDRIEGREFTDAILKEVERCDM